MLFVVCDRKGGKDNVCSAETGHKRIYFKSESTDAIGQEDLFASPEQRDQDHQTAELLRPSG